MLTEKNFKLYAAKSYITPCYIDKEFEQDLKRIKYIKRLLSVYKVSGEIKCRLVLNHIVQLYNVFGIPCATRMLFFKLNKEDYSVIKTMLIYLNYMPEKIIGISENTIYSSDIPIDFTIANQLRVL